jgi:hypothetical protein
LMAICSTSPMTVVSMLPSGCGVVVLMRGMLGRVALHAFHTGDSAQYL